MRVVALVQKPQGRGAELAAALLESYLRKRGHSAHTVYLYPATASAEIAADGARCLDGREGHLLETTLGWNPALLGRLRAALAELRPEVVVANGARTLKYGALAARRSRDRRWALVYRSIGDPRAWVRGFRRRLFYGALVMPAVDAVAAISQASLTALEELHGTETVSAVIPGVVDLDSLPTQIERAALRESLGSPAEAPVILWAGSLSDEKRPDRLLRIAAAAAAPTNPIDVWVAGEGPLRSGIESAARELEPAVRVRCLGWRSDLASLMAAADLLLITSDTEGMPAVALEAGALGLPVVATDVGGVGESVIDGQTGLLFAPTDEEGMADAVARLLAEPQRRAEMARAGRSWVRESFALDRVGPTFEDFFSRTLAARTSGTRAEAAP